eukprot:457705-Amphidinium_carterae.1
MDSDTSCNAGGGRSVRGQSCTKHHDGKQLQACILRSCSAGLKTAQTRSSRRTHSPPSCCTCSRTPLASTLKLLLRKRCRSRQARPSR